MGSVERHVVVQRLAEELVGEVLLGPSERRDEQVGVASLAPAAAAQERTTRKLERTALESIIMPKMVPEES